MTFTTNDILILLAILAGASLFFASMLGGKKKKDNLTVNRGKKKRTDIRALRVLYERTPILNRMYYRIHDNVALIYPESQQSIDARTVTRMTKNLGITLAIAIGVIVLSAGDIFFIGFGLTIAIIIGISNEDATSRKLKKQILLECKEFIDGLCASYMNTGNGVKSIDDALEDCLDDLPAMIRLHAQKVYDVLIAADPANELEEYKTSSPDSYVLSILSYCLLVLENGDTKDENGMSNFVKNLNHLKAEIEQNLLKINELDHAFRSMGIACLVPLLAIKPIELISSKAVPEMSVFFSNGYGVESLVGVFFVCIFCYLTINNLHSDTSSIKNVNTIWSRIAKRKTIALFMHKLESINYSKTKKIYDNLRMTGSSLTVSAFRIKSICFGIVGFLIVETMFIFATVQDIRESYNDFSGEFESTLLENSEMEDEFKNISTGIIRQMKKNNATEEEIRQYVMTNYGKNETYSTMISQTVYERITEIDGMYFKWYHLLAGIAGFMAGYAFSFYLLSQKTKSVNYDMQDEIVQFKTIIIMLMHMKSMTAEIILEWFERFAFCFKPSISKCLLDIAADEEGAIREMKDAESYKPFTRICDQLLNIGSIGVEKSFAQIEAEQAQSLKEREQNDRFIIESKVSKAKKLAIIPVYAVLILKVLIPWILSSEGMFSSMNNILNIAG